MRDLTSASVGVTSGEYSKIRDDSCDHDTLTFFIDDETDTAGVGKFLCAQKERFLAPQRFSGAFAAQREQRNGRQRDQAPDESGDAAVIAITFIDQEVGRQQREATQRDGKKYRYREDVR